jgi:hypothetical protein
MKNLFYLLCLIAISSCGKTDGVKIENTSRNSNCELGLTHQEIANIGIVHNVKIKELFENFDFKDQNYAEQIENRLKAVFDNISEHDLDKSINDYNLYFENTSFSNIINSGLTMNYFNEIHASIDEALSIIDLNLELNDIYSRADLNLVCIDREAVLIAIEVARNSSLLWFPVEMGGEGFLHETVRSESRGPTWWKKLVRNDLGGATFAVFRLGGALALGAVPGTNVAIGGAIAVSAVGASAMGALWDD